MAVNLLALANKLGSGLGGGSSGSRTRSSYQNQPGNLGRGTHIPGTNLKEDQGIRTVARKGRKGDSELRRVGGEVSHVNKTEANAIDALGPMGEAWVQSIGSGTRNPQTGRPEYWPKFLTPPKSVTQAVQSGLDWIQEEVPGAQTIADRWDQGIGPVAGMAKNIRQGTTWKPSEGKWGWFGQTDASKERDRAKAESAVRKDMFEKFRRGYEEENIASIFTENTEDDTDLLIEGGYGSKKLPGFESFVTEKSGLNHPTGNVTSDDINKYLDPYDTRKEDEIDATLTRDLDKAKIATKELVAQQQGTGNQLSSTLFGQLTQSSDTTAVKNFAGSGDFAAEFAKKDAIKKAESQFGGIDRANEELGTDIAQTVADAASSTLNEQEIYNQEFWDNIVIWESAINS